MFDLLIAVTVYLFVMLGIIATFIAAIFLVEAYKAVEKYVKDKRYDSNQRL